METQKGIKLKKEFIQECISSNTLNEQDLLPTFLEFLNSLERKDFTFSEEAYYDSFNQFQTELKLITDKYNEIIERSEYNESYLQHEFDSYDQQSIDYIYHDQLWDMIGNISPEYSFFGSHEGNGSDMGFWLDERIHDLLENKQIERSLFWRSQTDEPLTFHQKISELEKVVNYLNSELSVTSGWNYEILGHDLYDLSEFFEPETGYNITSEYEYNEFMELLEIEGLKEEDLSFEEREDLENRAKFLAQNDRYYVYPVSVHCELLFHVK